MCRLATVLCMFAPIIGCALPLPPGPTVATPMLESARSHAVRPVMEVGIPTALGQPARPAVTQVSLDEAINRCLLADPKLRAGFEAINQANADALTASLFPNPDLTADVQLLPLTRPFTVRDQGGPPQLDVIVGFPIDWFVFGKRASAMASAALGVRAAEAEFADLMRRRVLEAALAYFDVLEARDLAELARKDLDALRQIEAEARKKKGKNGAASDVELNRGRLEITISQKTLRDAETTLRTARAKLRTLLGHAEANLDVLGQVDQPVTKKLMSAEEAYREALQNRPDLEALRWRSAQAQANMEVEKRKAFPAVKPSLGYTRQYQTKAVGFLDADSWSAWVEMGLPLFNRNQGERAKAASLAVQSDLEVQARHNELKAEIEGALEDVAAARANLDAQEQLRLAQQIRDAVNQAFQKGDQSLADMLDAQRTYRDAVNAEVASRASFWRSLYRFHAAVGRQVYR